MQSVLIDEFSFHIEVIVLDWFHWKLMKGKYRSKQLLNDKFTFLVTVRSLTLTPNLKFKFFQQNLMTFC